MTTKVQGYDAIDKYEDHYVTRGGMAFSFLSDDGKLVGPLVDCRGYLIERLQGFLIGLRSDHQYKYSKKMEEINLERTRLVVVRKGITVEEFDKELQLAMDLLHQLERDLHLLPSHYSRVQGIDKGYGVAFLVEGSKKWMHSPVMLSLYTLILRNAYQHKKGESYVSTLQNLKKEPSGLNIMRGIEHIVNNSYWRVFGKDMEKNYANSTVSHMHGMGIAFFSQENTANIKIYMEKWPHWVWPGQIVPKKKPVVKRRV
jgi:hypothetical protein